MSGQRDRRHVGRDRSHDDVIEVVSQRRPSGHHDQRDTSASSHARDSRSSFDGARPRYVRDEQPQSRGGDRVDGRHEPAQPQHLETSNRHGTTRETNHRPSPEPQDQPSDSDADTERNYQMQTRPQLGHRSSRPVQESIATSRPRNVPSTAASGRPDFRSQLSPLAALFVSISTDDYDSCKTFIARKPEILDEDENIFIKDATAALASNQSKRASTHYARRCIQQSLLLRQCKTLDAKGRERFFARLFEEEEKTARGFLKESETVLKKCEELSERLVAAAPASSPFEPAQRETFLQRPDHASRQQSHRDALSQSFDGLTLGSPNRHGSGGYMAPGIPNSRPGNASRPQPNPSIQRRSSVANTGTETLLAATTDRIGLVPPKPGTVIRGTDGRAELDETYYKRKHAADFFVRGRVFALLWHEPVGESNNNNNTRSDRFSDVHSGRFGEGIISHIRRMVVVCEMQGKCWAIPINTYRGWGVAKHGFKPVDIAGHAVIHDATKEPYVAPREPAMSKKPLKVEMMKGETLHPMSRVNFTTVHTVQWNVKVKNIGMMHQDSKQKLKDYWAAQTASSRDEA